MPIATPSALENRHLAVPNLSRNDSLKSERSDKRVSFNNDVGVKHIPRGSNKPPAPLPPPQKSKPDEWSGCKPVKLQHNNLSEVELQREADSLVNLVDSINCKASPLPSRKNKDYSSRSLDRSHKKNNIDANHLRNGVNYTHITNPLIKHLKADLNRADNKSSSCYSDSDSEWKRRAQYKSVPNLVSANYNNTPYRSEALNGTEKPVNYSSVDNLLDKNSIDFCNNNLAPKRTGHLSAEDLLDYSTHRNNSVQHKSLGNLSRPQDSDSSDSSYRKKPRPDEIVRRLNRKNNQSHMNGHLSSDRDSSPSRKLSSSSKNSQYSDRVFPPKITNIQYKDNNFIASSQPQSEEMYAQVNKNNLRKRLSLDSDYSAKIIISEDKPRQTYDEDDTYETYQVANNTLHGAKYKNYGVNLSNSSDKFRNNDNINMNMSSVAVQTDGVRKALNNNRRTPKAMAPQPPIDRVPVQSSRSRRDLTTDLPSANLVRQVNHGFGRYDRSPSPPPRRTYNQSSRSHIVPLLSDTSDSEPEYRRRTDPLAKIRHQVLSNDKLQEDHAIESYEERNMNVLNQRTHDLDYNSRNMRQIPIREVENLSSELDESHPRSYFETKSNLEHNSSIVKTNQSSNVIGVSSDKPVNVERSYPTRPLREKSSATRDSSVSRHEEATSQTINTSEEKSKENDKKTGTFRFRGKDKKNKDTLKDKKKKRIKIKFFYDPRPQDKAAQDPLNSFTEYTGNDSPPKSDAKTASSSKNNQPTPRGNQSPSLERSKIKDVQGRTPFRDRSREHSRDRLRDHSKDRTLSRPGKDTNPPRGLRNRSSSVEASSDERRRIRSTDHYERRNEFSTHKRDQRNVRRYSHDFDHKEQPDKRFDDSDSATKNEYNRSRYDSNSHYEHNQRPSQPVQRRSTFLERRDAYERRESSNHDNSMSPRQEISPRFNPSKPEPSRYSRVNADSQGEHERSEEEHRATRTAAARVTLTEDARTAGATTLRRNSRRPDDSPPPVRRGRVDDSPPPVRRGRVDDSPPPVRRGRVDDSRPPVRRGRADDSPPPVRRGRVDDSPPPVRRSQKPGVRAEAQYSPDRQLGDRSRQRQSRVAEQREARQWESATLQHPTPAPASRTLDARGSRPYSRRRFSEESSASSGGEQRPGDRRHPGYRQKHRPGSQYDEDPKSGPGDYRSLPVRAHRTGNTRPRAVNAGIGSAGSSLQSSESENDSHHGSRASHVSTGSNRSVYLHATAVADIPVTDGDSRPGVRRQARKVTRSFSMAAPWRPRRPSKDAPSSQECEEGGRAAKPPRPPRRPSTEAPVGRAHTLTQKDSKLSGWLRKRKGKEGKGI